MEGETLDSNVERIHGVWQKVLDYFVTLKLYCDHKCVRGVLNTYIYTYIHSCKKLISQCILFIEV